MSCILIWCYGSDSGGSGNGCCGHHMHSPVKKKVGRVKKQKTKDLPKAQDMLSQASFIVLGVIIVLVVAGYIEMVVWGCSDMSTRSDKVVRE